ncbi:unnamed protein product [Urochloa decumbens]|uniref:Protein kinase domain-containing protein n=1 Tax=Urochloa decumbens TaxID=240449 RepID=A0ABC8VXV6_9POAL
MKKMQLLLPLLLASLISAASGTECPQQCGDVNIPYPFGIGDGCYLETALVGDNKQQPFNVTCSSDNRTSSIGKLELLSVDVAHGKVRVKSPVSSWCRDPANKSSMGEQDTWWYDLSAAFRVSDADNKLTVLGCNVLAYVWSRDGGADDKYIVGCNATCAAATAGARSPAASGAGDGGGDGSSCCDADGCCQAPIRPGTSFDVSFVDDYDGGNDNSSGPTSPCAYAMLVETKAFKFRRTYVTTRELSSAGGGGQVPMVLDWSVGNQTCDVGGKNTAAVYAACRSGNSHCVPSNNGPGYLCSCSQGYEGNPYQDDGCKDIDECKTMDQPCPAYSICRNTHGRHECYELKWLLGIVGSCIFVVLLGTAMSCTYAIREKKRLAAIKRQHFRQHGGYILFEQMKSREGQGHSFTLFTKEELEDATNKFNEQNVLGKGGNGTVYRGNLKDGRAVAIKRCRIADDERQRREFGKEMLILSQVNHRNIVKLYGCCLEVEVPMLVYQFIPNGTLHELIHRDGAPPSFAVLLKIAHEAADAMAYLHSMASPPIIHGDVKSPNILLDDNYAVKVSDFGASVLAPTDNAHLVTLVQGTRGYLDPEYMQTCRLTDKSDVYSFGVVLLELLTRRMALAMTAPEEERSLAAHFLSSMRDGKLDALLDLWIKDEVRADVIEMVATLAKRCLEMSGEKRPSMLEVAEELDSIRKLCLPGDITILVCDS